MTGSTLIGALLIVPLATALAAFATRWLGGRDGRAAEIVHLAGITLTLALAIAVIDRVVQQGTLLAADGWVLVDALGAIFLGVIALVGFLTGLYSIGYIRHDLAHGEIRAADLCTYYGFFNLFVFTMLLAVTTNNIIMMWVAVEATTLGSVFLVGFYRRRRAALEAAWKYVVICTVGVALGLYGTVLVFSSANAALGHAERAALWTEVARNAGALDPATIAIAFVFVLIGFGTKAGLFPMHTWLPDAHSEAPSPASALLSAALLNCALLVIIRHAVIAAKAVGPDFPRILLLVFGVTSVAVAALLIFVQRDVKRLLAYSSVENMGLIALGLGLGGPLGAAAALLHAINHSLAKALLFCCSGNILMKYGTRDLGAVKGMLRVAPASGAILMAGALALAGMPPFNVFVSELLTVTAGVKAGYGWLMLLVLVLLTIVLTALVRMISGSVLGPAPDTVRRGDFGALTLVPLAALLGLVLLMGLHVPRPVVQLIGAASETILGTGTQATTTEAENAVANPWSLIRPDAFACPKEDPTCRK